MKTANAKSALLSIAAGIVAVTLHSGVPGAQEGGTVLSSFLRPDGRQDADTPTELVVKHLEHILKHVGEDCVGFGSDFDGATIPTGIGNAAGLQNLVEAMRTRGFGEPLIEMICFRNWLRVLGRTWGVNRREVPAPVGTINC